MTNLFTLDKVTQSLVFQAMGRGGTPVLTQGERAQIVAPSPRSDRGPHQPAFEQKTSERLTDDAVALRIEVVIGGGQVEDFRILRPKGRGQVKERDVPVLAVRAESITDRRGAARPFRARATTPTSASIGTRRRRRRKSPK